MAALEVKNRILALFLALCAFSLASCDEDAAANVEPIKIKGVMFHVETALDETTRIKGMSGRDFIAEEGGMVFVFPRAQQLEFVMRDCPIPIDVAFLDGAGRVVAMHEMPPESPRREEETPMQYESRLKRYSSRFPAVFAVEVRGGRLKELGLEAGDRLDFDVERLKRQAR